jgi:hypothetical protein
VELALRLQRKQKARLPKQADFVIYQRNFNCPP